MVAADTSPHLTGKTGVVQSCGSLCSEHVKAQRLPSAILGALGYATGYVAGLSTQGLIDPGIQV